VTINDALPLKAAITNLKYFLGLDILAADKLGDVSFTFAAGRHVNAA